ncbi:MAG: cyclase family protein [Actinomycetota bacterium]|nr:cyclase family protein [Actinomycetota bacterium]
MGITRKRVSVGLALALAVGFFAGQSFSRGKSASGAPEKILGFGEVVYLSHVNKPGMPIFPGDPKFQLRTLYTVEEDGFRLNFAGLGEHSGSHWGAPCHFNASERCAEDMAPEDFFHPGVVIDARSQSRRNPDYALAVSDLKRFEDRHGRIPDNAIVIMWSGWQARWDDPGAYFNQDSDGVLHFPGISVEATRWLIERRSLGGLGIDTHGVDPGIDELYRTNTLLLKKHRIHLENLGGLQRMPPNGGWVVVGGVRNVGGSGSPATVFGLVP